LRLGQIESVAQDRLAQLVQRSEWHFQLGLDPGDLQYPTARRLAGAVVHEGGLAYSGLTAQCQDSALAGPNTIQHVVERPTLACPPPKGGYSW
jgi:hypothetical protein